VRRLFGIFALGSGISANALPVQCFLGWNVLEQTWFYIGTAFLSLFGPLLVAACYWLYRYVMSRIPTWNARYAAWRRGPPIGGDAAAVPPPPGAAEDVEPHHRRRRSSLINTITERVAESDVNGDVAGPALQELQERFACVVTDPSGRATCDEFTVLVAAAAPSVAFIDAEWEDRKDEHETIGFDDFRLVTKKIEVRQTFVIVVTATVVAVFFNYMKVSTQLVAIFMPSDIINGMTYLSIDLDMVAYTPAHVSTLVFAAITLLIFTIGAPIGALCALIHFNRLERLDEPEIFTMFGFLYAGYKPKFYWWESMVLLRKVLATIIALAPIGLELQVICAAVLLIVFTGIQLVLRPFKNERHNMLDCAAMGSIALKQLCALAYHYVVTNAVDTAKSQQLLFVVSWVVTIVVLSTSISLIAFFVIQFTLFKLEEMNADRRRTVAAEQKAWRTDVEMELSTKEKVLAFAKRVLCAVWVYVKRKVCLGGGGGGGTPDGEEEEGDDGGGGGDVVVQVRGGERDELKERVVAFTSESVANHEHELREIDEEIKDYVAGVEAAEARREAMLAKHDEIIALRLIEGEEIDGDGTIVMAREPLTVFGLAEAKMCSRCCRNKRMSRLHIPTGVVTRGAVPEIVVPNAAAGAAAVPLQQRQQVVTINPVGIAMQVLSRAVRPTSAATMSGDGSGGDAAAARSGGDVRSAAAKVNAPPRDDSVAAEGGGGGGGGGAARSGGGRSDALGVAGFVSLVIGSGGGAAVAHSGGGRSDDTMHFNRMARGSGGGAAATRGGGEQNDTLHFNRMAFGRLSVDEGGGSAGVDGDAAPPRVRVDLSDDGADSHNAI